jgi:hypothetical protein
MNCLGCDRTLGPCNKSGLCRDCYLRRRCTICSAQLTDWTERRRCPRCRRPQPARAYQAKPRLVPPGQEQRIVRYMLLAQRKLPLFEGARP